MDPSGALTADPWPSRVRSRGNLLAMASTLPPDNRALSNAMFLFQKDPGPPTARPLYEALLDATLVLLERDDTTEVLTDIVFSGQQKHFHLLKGEGGRVAVPVFTDPQAVLARYPQGGSMVYFPAQEVAQALAGKTWTMVINPTGHQPSGVHIPRRAIQALAEGKVPDFDPAN
jgi:type III secretion system (T3SS) SseB-like protein